jgi:hypothetical protein
MDARQFSKPRSRVDLRQRVKIREAFGHLYIPLLYGMDTVGAAP